MEFINVLRTRRSIRSYKTDAVKQEDLNIIIDCGRLAPSGGNRQAWRFVVVTDGALKRKIADASDYGKFIGDAGACVAVFCSKDALTPLEDASAATTAMLFAAHALGYGTCWVGVHGNKTGQRLHDILNVPEDYSAMTLFALGIPNGEAAPKKKSVEDVISYNGF